MFYTEVFFTIFDFMKRILNLITGTYRRYKVEIFRYFFGSFAAIPYLLDPDPHGFGSRRSPIMRILAYPDLHHCL